MLVLTNLAEAYRNTRFSPGENGVLVDSDQMPLRFYSDGSVSVNGKTYPNQSLLYRIFKALKDILFGFLQKIFNCSWNISSQEYVIYSLADSGFKELCNEELPRWQNLGRPLNQSEKEELGLKKNALEAILKAAGSVWDKMKVRPRTPSSTQYGLTGTHQKVSALLA